MSDFESQNNLILFPFPPSLYLSLRLPPSVNADAALHLLKAPSLTTESGLEYSHAVYKLSQLADNETSN